MAYIIFECAKAHLNARLAQLVEQRTENPCVSGSIPEPGTKRTSLEVLFYCNCRLVLEKIIKLSTYHVWYNRAV